MEMLEAVRGIAGHLESWLELQRDRARVPGVQAAIRVNGELAFSVALGTSDVETGEALTTSHLFHIASHSKTFTATACLQLVEAGVLRLDDKAGTWLPALEGAPVADLTIRELLGHQAGVNRDSTDSDYWQLIGDFPGEGELLARLREDTVFGPNEHFKYSNMGYSLLGLVVEEASGMSFEEYVQAHVVAPLGLSDLGTEVPEDRVGDLAGAHTLRFSGDEQRRVIPHVPTHAMAAATGCYGTAESTSAYLSAHAFGRGELLTDASKRLMQRKESTITRGGTRYYGLGLQMGEVGGRMLVGHSGGWPGHITQTWLDPQTGLCVSVLCNALGAPATDWASALVRWIDLALAAPTGADVPEGIDPATFTGRYAQMWGITDVALIGGRLVENDPTSTDVQAATIELTVRDADTLDPAPEAGYGSVGEPLRFERDADGHVVAMRSGGSLAWPIDSYRRRRDAGEVR